MSIEAMKQALEALEDAVVELQNSTKTVVESEKREWVGLTESEKAVIRGSVKYSQFMSSVEYGVLVQDATEAKLREKNACGWQSAENPTECLDELRGGDAT